MGWERRGGGKSRHHPSPPFSLLPLHWVPASSASDEGGKAAPVGRRRAMAVAEEEEGEIRLRLQSLPPSPGLLLLCASSIDPLFADRDEGRDRLTLSTEDWRHFCEICTTEEEVRALPPLQCLFPAFQHIYSTSITVNWLGQGEQTMSHPQRNRDGIYCDNLIPLPLPYEQSMGIPDLQR